MPTEALEKNIENRFVTYARSVGARAEKLTLRDWPDRMVLYPGGLFFLEFKRPGEWLRPGQRFRVRELEKLGQKVYVCDSFEAAKRCLDCAIAEAAALSKRSRELPDDQSRSRPDSGHGDGQNGNNTNSPC